MQSLSKYLPVISPKVCFSPYHTPPTENVGQFSLRVNVLAGEPERMVVGHPRGDRRLLRRPVMNNPTFSVFLITFSSQVCHPKYAARATRKNARESRFHYQGVLRPRPCHDAVGYAQRRGQLQINMIAAQTAVLKSIISYWSCLEVLHVEWLLTLR